MKSMKQIADELNVTKMTVYNNAKKANVKFQKIENVNYLSAEDEIIIANRIKKNQNKSDYFDNEKKVETKPNNDSSVKDETIKHLYNQLDIYKEQSNRDKEQIKTLNRLLENQQILALESNKKIQKLESQLEEEKQLNYSFDTSTNDRQNINLQEATFTEESQNINQQQKKRQPTDIEIENNDVNKEKKNGEEATPKKGFWNRLFGN
ncbi:DUF536 domain-containing protein [Staphylococcus saccharolyticus]|uniref:DUF536 domain-containing protein n=1 Tax=Staphylococcus saccharolyticus TaxID=33028 RepID=UPI0032DF7637